MPSKIEEIGTYPFFQKQSEAVQQGLTKLLTPVTIDPDVKKILFHFKDDGDTIYFLCSGSVEMFYEYRSANSEHSVERRLETIHPGDFFGEVATFLSTKTPGQRSASARVITRGTALLLHKHDVEAFLKLCPDATLIFLHRMAERLDRSGRQIHDAAVLNANEVIAAHKKPPSFGDNVVAKITKFLRSGSFFVIHGIFYGSWVVGFFLWQITQDHKLEPFPFDFLGLIAATEALLFASVILMNQYREEQESKLRMETEYNANIHAALNIQTLLNDFKQLRTDLNLPALPVSLDTEESTKRLEEKPCDR